MEYPKMSSGGRGNISIHKLNRKEWNEMFASPGEGTGMPADEALEIVLHLARSVEHVIDPDEAGLDEWRDEHSEACGVVDSILTDMLIEGVEDHG
jgi:hypothetical protein